MKIVVIVPAYNEEKTIGSVIDSISEVMKSQKYNSSILIVNDGSSDNTALVAKKHGAIVFNHSINYGLAEAFKTGVKEALKLKPSIIVHTDADGQYLAREIPFLVSAVKKGNHLVLGSRFRGKIESMPLIKRMGNRAFSKVISKIIRFPISDGQTGLRAFTPELAKEVEIGSKHTYTQEQILRAAQLKFRIAEVPVTFKRRNGKSRLVRNPFEYAFKAWINILRIYRDYEPIKFFGIFGSVFILPGILLGLWLLSLFLSRGFVGHLPSVMLTVLLLSIGVQMWLFGFLADMQRK